MIAFVRGFLPLAAALLWLLAPPLPAQGADLRIGVINMNKALNTSDAGERSKKVLLASKGQKENELKAGESELKRMADELRTNIMLTDAAKGQKERELRERDAALRQEVQNAQRELQEQERKLTESIFAELKTVVGIVAQEQKLDIVLELGAAQAILFSRYKFTDITDDVVSRYNKIQTAKP